MPLKPLSHIIFVLALALGVALAATAARLCPAAPAWTGQTQCVRLPAVMYHHILEETSLLNDYTILPQELREDLLFLQREGYTPILIRDLIRYTQGEPLPEKPILLTFDDGYESFAVYAFPLLEEFGYPAVYSVIGSWADFYSQRQEHRVRYSHTDWETLQALQQSGLVEVQNHSYDLHRLEDGQRGAQRCAGEPASAYQQRLAQDLRQLQEHCAQNLGGWQPTCFAWPFGFSSPEALPILRQLGISAALTCEERINTLTGDPEELFHLGRFNRPHGKPLEQILAAAQAP